VWDAFDAMCWILARREMVGATVKDVYRLHKQAAGGPTVPSLLVIYTVSDDVISLHAVAVGNRRP
jgi:hypothetical protein